MFSRCYVQSKNKVKTITFFSSEAADACKRFYNHEAHFPLEINIIKVLDKISNMIQICIKLIPDGGNVSI